MAQSWFGKKKYSLIFVYNIQNLFTNLSVIPAILTLITSHNKKYFLIVSYAMKLVALLEINLSDSRKILEKKTQNVCALEHELFLKALYFLHQNTACFDHLTFIVWTNAYVFLECFPLIL